MFAAWKSGSGTPPPGGRGHLLRNGERLKGTEEEVCTSLDSWTHRVVDPQLVNPYDLAAPDFRPESDSPALQGFASPPSDGFFEAVSFVGGVGAEGPPWYRGWTTMAGS